MCLFKGSGVALITPFKNNRIDYERLREIINWQIESGTDAIIISGTTGESATLSKAEKKELFEFTVKTVDKRVPVIAGTGGNNTSDVIELSQAAEYAGCDGLLIVTPYYNKTTQEGLVTHFTKVAESVRLPIIMYNVPSRTGLNMKPETVESLSRVSNIAGIKEASGDISQIAQIAKFCDNNFTLYSGNDDQIVPVLALGGKGVISVLANIMPKETHDLCAMYFNGETEAAKNSQLKLLSLINTLFIETNPIPVKTALALMGKDSGEVRLPLVKMSAKNKALLEKELVRAGLIEGD